MDDKQTERIAFLRYTTHLEKYTQPFLHGFQRQHHKDAADVEMYNETKKQFVKREFERKEANGMARLGWSPEDWYKIKEAIQGEDLKTVEPWERRNSMETVATDVSSVFDTEEATVNDEDSKEEDIECELNGSCDKSNSDDADNDNNTDNECGSHKVSNTDCEVNIGLDISLSNTSSSSIPLGNGDHHQDESV